MLKITKKQWKGFMWTGEAFLLVGAVFEFWLMTSRSFPIEKFLLPGFYVTWGTFCSMLGALKASDIPRWMTITLTTAATIVMLIASILIAYYCHK